MPWGNDAVGAAAATDGRGDNYSAYVWNRFIANTGKYRAQTRVYEPQISEASSDDESFYRPDVARSVDRSPDRWMMAMLGGDSMTSNLKQLRFAERDVGGGNWTTTSLGVTVTRPHVAITYDPVRDRFVFVVETDSGLLFGTRQRTGGVWGMVQTGIQTFDGADLACSAWGGPGGMNCILAHVNRAAAGTLRWRRFSVTGTGAVVNEGTDRLVPWLGFTRPTVTVNPDDADPQFVLSFSQAASTIYLRQLNRNSTTWTVAQWLSASSSRWLTPGGLGVWGSAGVTTDMMVVE